MLHRSFVVLSCLFIPLTVLRAQEQPATTAATQTAPAEKTDADTAFEPIQRQFNHLYQSLINKGGAGREDRPAIEALRQRVIAFSAQYPSDERGLAAELHLSKWLGDQERVDAIYEKVLQLHPEDQKARLTWANQLKAQNRFARAIEMLNGVEWKDEHVIDARTALSDCLFAEQRFQEAVDALATIPESAWTLASTRKPEIEKLISDRRQTVDLWAKEILLRQAEGQADDLPRAVIATDRGPIVVELFENEAPNTVANFVKLAETKFYDGTKFHRVINNFMAQGGDPNSRPGATGVPGQGNPGYYIPDEVTRENARNHFTGSLAMAKTEAPNTAGCQFYLTHMPTPHLNGRHTVFGRVLTGEEFVREIKNDDVIETITILRKRDHAYEPVTLPLEPTAATIPAATIPASTLPAATIPTIDITPIPTIDITPTTQGSLTGRAPEPATQPVEAPATTNPGTAAPQN